jgi:hypothetical protein
MHQRSVYNTLARGAMWSAYVSVAVLYTVVTALLAGSSLLARGFQTVVQNQL